ncbi:hypothetical protein PFISCL1PPCAC_24980, partial [Pristionchus fissidentatus]
MEDEVESFNGPPADDIGILSQASRRELLDLSEAVVRRTPAVSSRRAAKAKNASKAAANPTSASSSTTTANDSAPAAVQVGDARNGKEPAQTAEELRMMIAINGAMQELMRIWYKSHSLHSVRISRSSENSNRERRLSPAKQHSNGRKR